MNEPTIDQLREGKQRHLDYLFAGREPLNDTQLWETYFKAEDVALDTVARVRRILSDILEVNLVRIRATDNFSKRLSFFWHLDSLADLKIMHALEEDFKITISDAEAEAMKTFRDIVLGVHGKLIKPPA